MYSTEAASVFSQGFTEDYSLGEGSEDFLKRSQYTYKIFD